ncbi:aminoacyl-tRNA hydrolase [Candidatus Roizmanbacteria bacterium RIFCSPLOWO2_01_FULL_37_12]|uniref:Peptidyl-tRNA hydrolase n=1 Tax=Candidatus Roizmanbacteria bacterium RIFCSPLOWO2_01_FULL_37_12 TaxID=1802056 RepID=A0A1F7IFZ5_9BACT|nr:MAG: aminoacyl-tRNA hydrolase [Candidatus Roizmanbacteria bacterium RIFCSPHIGHO2_01_FULL_37_16]OGK42285.1 MAG: aminoacyl-tRNA hydrolase [Candidatus Roizmanbacteria bacterium RIFCSPLOWO2_01_FULL_37_12]
MKLIVGLGNPGEKYQSNRHNVGFMFVDYIVSSLAGGLVYSFNKSGNAEYVWTTLKKENVEFYKPMTYMNKSGESVKYAFKKHPDIKPNNIYVVHDDLDIPLGKFKIQKGVGPKLHNGIESIEKKLAFKDFWRVRIGVDNRASTGWIDGEIYTLQDFKPEEKEVVDQSFPEIWNRLKQSAFSLK